MKRAFWLVGVACVLVAATASRTAAQEMKKPTWTVYVGGNMSSVSSDDITDASYRAGFLAGVGLGWELNSRWSFAPEAQFTQKGVSAKESGSDFKARVSYLEVPVLLRVNGDAMANGARVYGLGGGFIGFKSSCNIEGSQGGITVSGACDEFGADVETMDYGVAVGVGFDWTAGGRKWSLSGRYDWGLADVAKESGAATANTRSIAVVLGLSW